MVLWYVLWCYKQSHAGYVLAWKKESPHMFLYHKKDESADHIFLWDTEIWIMLNSVDLNNTFGTENSFTSARYYGI